MNPLSTIGAIALALAIGAAGGWYEKGVSIKAGEVTVMKEALHTTAANVIDSTTTSTAVEHAISKDADRITEIDKAVAKRVSTNTPERHRDNSQTLPTGTATGCTVSDPVLDIGTVRLLNAARSGTDLDSTTSDTGQK